MVKRLLVAQRGAVLMLAECAAVTTVALQKDTIEPLADPVVCCPHMMKGDGDG